MQRIGDVTWEENEKMILASVFRKSYSTGLWITVFMTMSSRDSNQYLNIHQKQRITKAELWHKLSTENQI